MGKPNPPQIQSILATFLRIQDDKVELERCTSYMSFYNRTWNMLGLGLLAEADTTQRITKEQVQVIAEKISRAFSKAMPYQRVVLRADLAHDSNFENFSTESLNQAISIALRLWLVLNIREGRTAPGTKPITWNDEISLQELVVMLFPSPRLPKELSEQRFDFVLPSSFTVVNLRRFSGIKIDWTYSLNEHLDLDRDHRRLKIFPLKYYLQGLKNSGLEIIPSGIIDEYTKTMNFLFPDWDEKTQVFLQRKGQTFGMEAPIDYPGPLQLSDFHFWSDRLLVLHTEFRSPPPSMTQLFYDRRNVLQWYTFWFAVLIVVLTVIFGVIASITSCLQTKYTYQTLLLAIQAASSADACPTHYVSNSISRFHS